MTTLSAGLSRCVFSKLFQEMRDRCLLLAVDRQTLSAFEAWVYSVPQLEDILAPKDYLFFLEIDYSSSLAVEEILKWANCFFGSSFLSECETLKLKKQLETILTNERSFPNIMEDVFDLREISGYRFLDELLDMSDYFTFLNDMSIPGKTDEWDRLRATPKGDRQLSETYFPGFRESLEQVIRWLEMGEIVVHRKSDFSDDAPIFRMEDCR